MGAERSRSPTSRAHSSAWIRRSVSAGSGAELKAKRDASAVAGGLSARPRHTKQTSCSPQPPIHQGGPTYDVGPGVTGSGTRRALLPYPEGARGTGSRRTRCPPRTASGRRATAAPRRPSHLPSPATMASSPANHLHVTPPTRQGPVPARSGPPSPTYGPRHGPVGQLQERSGCVQTDFVVAGRRRHAAHQTGQDALAVCSLQPGAVGDGVGGRVGGVPLRLQANGWTTPAHQHSGAADA